MHRLLLVLIACSILLAAPSPAWAQTTSQVASTVTATRATGAGLVVVPYTTVCALWAIYTPRNPVGWFIVGLLFTIFAAMAVLYQASRDRRE